MRSDVPRAAPPETLGRTLDCLGVGLLDDALSIKATGRAAGGCRCANGLSTRSLSAMVLLTSSDAAMFWSRGNSGAVTGFWGPGLTVRTGCGLTPRFSGPATPAAERAR